MQLFKSTSETGLKKYLRWFKAGVIVHFSPNIPAEAPMIIDSNESEK